MRLIGFIGPKGAGKDEAARILGEHSKIYGKLSFAGPLKKICQQLTGLHSNFFNDPILKEKELKEPVVLTSRFLRSIKKELPLWVPEIQDNKRLYNADTMSITGLENQVMKTPRQLLQIVGTEFIRDRAFVDWHVNAAFGEKAMSELKGTAYAITDIRFPNELAYLQNKFPDQFVCYYIERPEAEERLATATHPSELLVKELRTLIGEDCVIKNDGTVEDFEKVVLGLALPQKKKGEEVKKPRFVYGERK